MPERPLLFFPTPTGVERYKKKSLIDKNIKLPGRARQGERLGGNFEKLESDLEAQRIAIQNNPNAVEPEYTLIFVVKEGIEESGFQTVIRYLRKIDGGQSELLLNEDLDACEADNDFAIEDKPDKMLSRKLYCVLSSMKALGELLRLWKGYAEEDDFEFPRGAKQFKQIFPYLDDIHRWGREERFEETGLRDIWEGELIATHIESVTCNIELFFRADKDVREKKASEVKMALENCGGLVLDEALIEEIAYHNLLVSVPTDSARKILAGELTSLLDCEPVMRIAPVGQVVEKSFADEFCKAFENVPKYPIKERPIVALLDGVPQANHKLLEGYLIVDDPDGLADTSETRARVHGTEMASLVVYGDLGAGIDPVLHKIYMRPILRAAYDAEGGCREEAPPNKDFVLLVKEAVERLFDETAYGETVRIINLSIGLQHAHFSGVVSPLAKLIDWLSWKYKVLFVISAGNCTDDIEMDECFDVWRERSVAERGSCVVRGMSKNHLLRRIIYPAESINGLTVGSVYHDRSSERDRGDLLLCSDHHFPSPYTSIGPGVRGAIKPDIVYPGGRIFARERLGKNNDIQFMNHASPPGVLVASPGISLDVSDVASYSRGTSCSAALISRQAQLCHDALVELFDTKKMSLPCGFEALIIKAMIVHGSSWDLLRDGLKKEFASGADTKKEMSRWIGYGWPDVAKARECSKKRATCIGYGRIKPDEGFAFRLPAPIDPHDSVIDRRLTVTLASFIPINPRSQKYRGCKVWFDLPEEAKKEVKFLGEREDAHNDSVQKGTIQHERFHSSQVSLWKEDDEVVIRVNCRAEAQSKCEPALFAIMASFEVLGDCDIDIYQRARDRIANRDKQKSLLIAEKEGKVHI